MRKGSHELENDAEWINLAEKLNELPHLECVKAYSKKRLHIRGEK